MPVHGDSFMGTLVNELPGAASSQVALLAYLTALASLAFILFRVARFSHLLKSVTGSTKADQGPKVTRAMKAVIPPGLSGEVYLRRMRTRYLTAAAFALFAPAVVVGLVALDRARQNPVRADKLTEKIFDHPTAKYTAALSTLSNGAQLIGYLRETFRTPLTDQQIEAAAKKISSDSSQYETISRILKYQLTGSDPRLVSNYLGGAADVVDSTVAELAECYRAQQCGRGSRFADMCTNVRKIAQSVAEINMSAHSVSRLNVNGSGNDIVRDNSDSNIYLAATQVPSARFLADTVCQGKPG